jgi:hypothetical protein
MRFGGVAVLAALGACTHDATPAVTAATPSAVPTAPGTTSASSEFAWVVGSCVATRRADLPSGTPLSVVLLSEPQTVVQAQVGAPAHSADGCPALAEGANAKGDASFYTLSSPALDATQMGIALVGTLAVPSIREGIARVDLEHDGHTQVFTACAASEGIHFAVWNDQPYRGKPRWTAYYYTGVDVEPNCPR